MGSFVLDEREREKERERERERTVQDAKMVWNPTLFARCSKSRCCAYRTAQNGRRKESKPSHALFCIVPRSCW